MSEVHPILTGEKVILARVRPEDVPVMARHFANLELTAYLGAIGGAFSLEDEQAYYESISKSKPDGVTFGIYTREGQTYIGGIDLRGVNHRHGTAELGVSVHDPEYWGGGYGSEAVRLMVEYGMFFLGLHNIQLNVFSYNTRGIAAYKKVGFREIGRRRGAIRLGGERFDAVLMDITADEVDMSRMRGLVRLLPATLEE
ncbi:GNAT family N-acetyltransferase [Deinococcus wulumuqiensis]|uniref:GNAT family N-acetyltransferase n=1 Tax=Deinococcus wulumuqiensis TaxID=980427 RepID=UPI002432EE02|nr:GNAT family protein [Deinococcus wulumuqiensis]